MRVDDDSDSEAGLEPINDDTTRYAFCYQHAKSVPQFLLRYAANLTQLDLSHNEVADLTGLGRFVNLQHLILDQNRCDDGTDFPPLALLQTLELNNNRLVTVTPLVAKIKLAYPALTYLSLLGNPACPSSVVRAASDENYRNYRAYVVSHLATLKFLDWKAVEGYERVADPSFLLYEEIPPQDDEDEDADADREQEEKGTARAGKLARRYRGTHSEGNRFIQNQDL